MIEDVLEGVFATSCGQRLLGTFTTVVFGLCGIYFLYETSQNWRLVTLLFGVLCLTTSLLGLRAWVLRKPVETLARIWLLILLATLGAGIWLALLPA